MPVGPRMKLTALGASATMLIGLALHEGYRDRTYDDGVGVNTIGFGRTSNVKPGDRTTVERELVFLDEDIKKRQQVMRACIGEAVPLSQAEWDAYLSLAYNIGTGAFCNSGAVRNLKKDPPDYEAACANILEWNRAGGQVLAGLVKRRRDEYEKCMGLKP